VFFLHLVIFFFLSSFVQDFYFPGFRIYSRKSSIGRNRLLFVTGGGPVGLRDGGLRGQRFKNSFWGWTNIIMWAKSSHPPSIIPKFRHMISLKI
jgi:hypothetical protein